MKEMTLEQIKEVELSILDYIDCICKEHGYAYYLAYGTLLGAVRHQGFIPWDDDIDILIPRKDYYNFIQTVMSKNERYKVVSTYNNSSYRLPFIKIIDSETIIIEKDIYSLPDMGVYVDIFPLDSLPFEYSQRKRIKNKAWRLRQIMDHATLWERGQLKRSIIYKVYCYLCYCYGWQRAFDQFEKLANKSNLYGKSGYYTDLAGAINKESEWGESCFEKKCYLLFEGKKYPAPFNYKEALKDYGDFMTLPPLDKRVSNHNFKAYYK